MEAAAAACRDPKHHKYTPVGGLEDLRDAVATKTARDSGLEVDPADVLITNGGKHAVYNAIAAVVDAGDEVLLPTPYWTTYPEPIALSGGVAVPVLATAASGFRVSVEQLEAARTSRTKALIFVSPSNPTGAVYPRSEIEQIGRWAAEHGIWVLTDEIYEHLTYGDAEHHSMPVVVPELRDRCIVLNGVAKTYAMTGWRVGWMIGPVRRDGRGSQPPVPLHLQRVQRGPGRGAGCGVGPAGRRRGDAPPLRPAPPDHARHAQRHRRAVVSRARGRLLCLPRRHRAAGPRLRRRSAGNTTLELADLLLERAKVAVVPGEAFGVGGGLRLSFALGDDDLGEGVGPDG